MTLITLNQLQYYYKTLLTFFLLYAYGLWYNDTIMAKPTWKPIRVRLGQIKAWEENPRLSTKAQAERIIASEKKFGQPLPFLLAPELDGRYPLLDGHQRLAAWITIYGEDYEMDANVASRPLTDEEHKELIITLHTGATGQWDWNSLSGWDAGDLQGWGMDNKVLDEWNNDANNLKELLAAEEEHKADPRKTLAERFGVPPFSVLNARGGTLGEMEG